MTKEIIDDNGIPKYLFLNIHGGGWESDLKKIINNIIKPEKIERELFKAGWHSSESEITFEKDGVQYKIYLDEYDSIEFYPISENFNLKTVRELANILDSESKSIQNRINSSK